MSARVTPGFSQGQLSGGFEDFVLRVVECNTLFVLSREPFPAGVMAEKSLSPVAVDDNEDRIDPDDAFRTLFERHHGSCESVLVNKVLVGDPAGRIGSI